MAIATINVENDADFFRSFVYQTTLGVPIDITGASLVMGVRKNATDATAYLMLTSAGAGITLDDPVNGRFSVRITQAQLLLLPIGDYVHSLIMTIGGVRKRLWSGTMTVGMGPSR